MILVADGMPFSGVPRLCWRGLLLRPSVWFAAEVSVGLLVMSASGALSPEASFSAV